MTTLQQLADKVRHMREAQKRYFSTRSPGALNDSKRLEKQIDELIKAIPPPIPQAEQKQLFTHSTDADA